MRESPPDDALVSGADVMPGAAVVPAGAAVVPAADVADPAGDTGVPYCADMKVVPMLQVADIPAASTWYQRVLGLVSGHGGDEFEMLFAAEPHASALLLQLHRWDAHEHGILGRPDRAVGNGASLWFEVADRAAFDARWATATATGAAVLAPPAWNPLAHHHEFSLHDRDGYVVVVHTPFDPTDSGVR